MVAITFANSINKSRYYSIKTIGKFITLVAVLHADKMTSFVSSFNLYISDNDSKPSSFLEAIFNEVKTIRLIKIIKIIATSACVAIELYRNFF